MDNIINKAGAEGNQPVIGGGQTQSQLPNQQDQVQQAQSQQVQQGQQLPQQPLPPQNAGDNQNIQSAPPQPLTTEPKDPHTISDPSQGSVGGLGRQLINNPDMLADMLKSGDESLGKLAKDLGVNSKLEAFNYVNGLAQENYHFKNRLQFDTKTPQGRFLYHMADAYDFVKSAFVNKSDSGFGNMMFASILATAFPEVDVALKAGTAVWDIGGLILHSAMGNDYRNPLNQVGESDQSSEVSDFIGSLIPTLGASAIRTSLRTALDVIPNGSLRFYNLISRVKDEDAAIGALGRIKYNLKEGSGLKNKLIDDLFDKITPDTSISKLENSSPAMKVILQDPKVRKSAQTAINKNIKGAIFDEGKSVLNEAADKKYMFDNMVAGLKGGTAKSELKAAHTEAHGRIKSLMSKRSTLLSDSEKEYLGKLSDRQDELISKAKEEYTTQSEAREKQLNEKAEAIAEKERIKTAARTETINQEREKYLSHSEDRRDQFKSVFASIPKAAENTQLQLSYLSAQREIENIVSNRSTPLTRDEKGRLTALERMQRDIIKSGETEKRTRARDLELAKIKEITDRQRIQKQEALKEYKETLQNEAFINKARGVVEKTKQAYIKTRNAAEIVDLGNRGSLAQVRITDTLASLKKMKAFRRDGELNPDFESHQVKQVLETLGATNMPEFKEKLNILNEEIKAAKRKISVDPAARIEFKSLINKKEDLETTLRMGTAALKEWKARKEIVPEMDETPALTKEELKDKDLDLSKLFPDENDEAEELLGDYKESQYNPTDVALERLQSLKGDGLIREPEEGVVYENFTGSPNELANADFETTGMLNGKAFEMGQFRPNYQNNRMVQPYSDQKDLIYGTHPLSSPSEGNKPDIFKEDANTPLYQMFANFINKHASPTPAIGMYKAKGSGFAHEMDFNKIINEMGLKEGDVISAGKLVSRVGNNKNYQVFTTPFKEGADLEVRNMTIGKGKKAQNILTFEPQGSEDTVKFHNSSTFLDTTKEDTEGVNKIINHGNFKRLIVDLDNTPLREYYNDIKKMDSGFRNEKVWTKEGNMFNHGNATMINGASDQSLDHRLAAVDGNVLASKLNNLLVTRNLPKGENNLKNPLQLDGLSYTLANSSESYEKFVFNLAMSKLIKINTPVKFVTELRDGVTDRTDRGDTLNTGGVVNPESMLKYDLQGKLAMHLPTSAYDKMADFSLAHSLKRDLSLLTELMAKNEGSIER